MNFGLKTSNRITGIIWWNLRDIWPILSDAVVDYYISRKLAYFYIKQVQHNVCVIIGDASEGKHPVIAENDTREKRSGRAEITDLATGKILFSAEFNIPANGSAFKGFIPEKEKEQAMWLINYSTGNKKYTNHYSACKAPFKLQDYQKWTTKLNVKRAL